MENEFFPEGILFDTADNKRYTSTKYGLEDSLAAERTLEGICVLCDNKHNLIIDLGGEIKGYIPREDGALGISDGITRDIALISRVYKPVCFKVTGFSKDGQGKEIAILSRKKAQKEATEKYVNKLTTGDIINVRTTHLEHFGCFVDIACGIASLIPIDSISVSRISHPSVRFGICEDIPAVVKSIENGRITLSHKELLGTWEENAARFQIHETVPGIVRGIEPYGIFIELTPNLAGLAESASNTEMSAGIRSASDTEYNILRDIAVGQRTSVYIKAIIPEKMKIKLSVVDVLPENFEQRSVQKGRYYITGGHIDRWVYSTEQSEKVIVSEFN